MTDPTSSWWRRHRSALETAVALLAVPAVIGVALLAGGAGGDDEPANDLAQAPRVTTSAAAPATTTAAPAPTTESPATVAPTTVAPTTVAPVTVAPTTAAPTVAPTVAPTTAAPTPAPTTVAPTTAPPAAVPTTAAPAPAPTASAPPAAAPQPATPSRPGSTATARYPLPQAGTGLLVGRGQVTPDLATWQRQMQERGWDIEADGVFGPETERVLLAFQHEKHLSVDGVLGVQSWIAAWTAPVT